MPLQDYVGESDKKSVKKPPRPKREFSIGDLVYRKGIEELRKEGREHRDLSILHVLLDTLHKLIPVAEENYQEYPFHTNAAAVNHLTNQLRETLADIRALEDFGRRGEIISDFVGAQYRQILQTMVVDLFTVQKTIQNNPTAAEDEFKKLRETFAKRFSDSEKTVRGRVTQLLHVKT